MLGFCRFVTLIMIKRELARRWLEHGLRHTGRSVEMYIPQAYNERNHPNERRYALNETSLGIFEINKMIKSPLTLLI